MDQAGPTELLACPLCKGPLRRGPTAYGCRRCSERYPLRSGVLDLRSSRCRSETGGEGWSLAEFEEAYDGLGDYSSSREKAGRAGVPEGVEEYRYPRIKGRLLEWVASSSSARAVLDIGCGVGYFLLEVESRLGPGMRLFAGIDVVPVRIRNTLSRFEGRENFFAAVASAEELPFGDEEFDLVICTEVMEHVARPERAFREIARVLRPGGLLFFSSPNRVATDLWEGLFGVPRLFRRLLRGALLRKESNPYDRPIGPRRLRRLFRTAGFGIEDFQLNVFLPHESYYQFMPGWVNRGIVRAGSFLESRAPALARWLGLHYVIRARRMARVRGG